MQKLERRTFISACFKALGSLFFTSPFLCKISTFISELMLSNNKSKTLTLREAMFYRKLDNQAVQCYLCFRRCYIPNGKRSFCRNKENRNGKLYFLAYGKPCAIHVDPIEKEPQLHMLPGSEILCVAVSSCNFRCQFCQNWRISQKSFEETWYSEVSPSEIVDEAIKKNIPTISFTYTDPIAFYEYMYDIARLAKSKGIKILVHSNCSFGTDSLKELLKYTDAVTVDLKAFDEEFYKNVSSASLAPVLNSLKIIKESGIWFEIVNLVIPTLNDSPKKIKEMCLWIKENLGAHVPLHFSRFFPKYRLTNLPPTPISTLEEAYRIAKDVGLQYVTIGNVPGHQLNSTYCPKCKKRIIHRVHFTVLSIEIVKGKCKFCGQPIPGIWQV